MAFGFFGQNTASATTASTPPPADDNPTVMPQIELTNEADLVLPTSSGSPVPTQTDDDQTSDIPTSPVIPEPVSENTLSDISATPALQMPDSVQTEEQPATLDPADFIFSPDQHTISPEPEDKEEQEYRPVIKPSLPESELSTQDFQDLSNSLSNLSTLTNDNPPLPPISDDAQSKAEDENEDEDAGKFSDTARSTVKSDLTKEIVEEENVIHTLERELANASSAYKQALAELENRRQQLNAYEGSIQEQQDKINLMKAEVRARRSRLSKVLQAL